MISFPALFSPSADENTLPLNASPIRLIHASKNSLDRCGRDRAAVGVQRHSKDCAGGRRFLFRNIDNLSQRIIGICGPLFIGLFGADLAGLRVSILDDIRSSHSGNRTPKGVS